MFGLYFGNYLLEHEAVPAADIDDLADLPHQAFFDRLDEKKSLSRDEAEVFFSGFRKEYSLDDEAIDAIDSGDIERIVPIFISFDSTKAVSENLEAYRRDKSMSDDELEAFRERADSGTLLPSFIFDDPQHYNQFVKLTFESIVRFISNRIILKTVRQMSSYSFDYLVCQELRGAHRIFLGISADKNSFLALAGKLKNNSAPTDAASPLDCMCETVNCIMGLYASALSYENIKMDIALPCYFSDKTIFSDGMLYCLPAIVDGVATDFIFSFDNTINIIEA